MFWNVADPCVKKSICWFAKPLNYYWNFTNSGRNEKQRDNAIHCAALLRALYKCKTRCWGTGQRRRGDILLSHLLFCILLTPSPPFAPSRRADGDASHYFQGFSQQTEQWCCMHFRVPAFGIFRTFARAALRRGCILYSPYRCSHLRLTSPRAACVRPPHDEGQKCIVSLAHRV